MSISKTHFSKLFGFGSKSKPNLLIFRDKLDVPIIKYRDDLYNQHKDGASLREIAEIMIEDSKRSMLLYEFISTLYQNSSKDCRGDKDSFHNLVNGPVWNDDLLETIKEPSYEIIVEDDDDFSFLKSSDDSRVGFGLSPSGVQPKKPDFFIN